MGVTDKDYDISMHGHVGTFTFIVKTKTTIDSCSNSDRLIVARILLLWRRKRTIFAEIRDVLAGNGPSTAILAANVLFHTLQQEPTTSQGD